MKKLSIEVAPALWSRVESAAQARNLTPTEFIVCMLQWHAPAGDNGEQQLRKKLVDIAQTGANSSDMMDEIEDLLGIGPKMKAVR